MEQMPIKTVLEIETECLRLLRANMTTREVTHIDLIRTHPTGSGPNWTWQALHPPQTRLAEQDADKIVATVAGRWAMD
jgi:hypothetical protein